jgi:hypothetical protein
MNYDDENLRPLSFDEDDILKPFVIDTKNNSVSDFVPLANANTNEIKNKDSNFVFFFGVSASGKSVILSAVLYFLKTKGGVLMPRPGTPNTKEAQVLLADFFENISKGILPSRTTRDQVTRMDFIFEPNNKSKKVPAINLTFLETAGGNHQDITRGGSYHSSIDKYLNANIPLNIIIVTSYDTAHRDDSLINEFFGELERKGNYLKSINVILVVSKWDISGRSEVANEDELENFIQERLPMTNNLINSYELSKTYFTIGDIEKNTGGDEKITILNLGPAEILSNWLYQSITGFPLDYEGTFWEKIKFSL